MNDIFHIAILLIKKKLRMLTKAEKQRLDAFGDDYAFIKKIHWSTLAEKIPEHATVDKETAWGAVLDKLEQRQKQSPVLKISRHRFRYVAAALIVLLFGFSYMVLRDMQQDNIPAVVNADTVIKTGTDKATLTLEDGSEVPLEAAASYRTKNAQSNGKQIVYKQATASEAVQTVYNYLTIPRGGQFFVQLSDGTKVWLNSESRLKYPVAFTDGETRVVELLYGEACFEVSPSTNHKGARFKVHTQIQEVEVLGTEFNIRAYRDESNVYTTLVEGKVAVNTPDAKQTLTPGQQLDLDLENNNTTISYVDVYNVISWKKGLFSFKSMPLKEIAKILSRWYDVDIEFADTALEEVRFNGVLGKDQDLEEILKNIQNTNFISAYEIKNKKITIR
ncbi:FecR family protein [Sinomicrobium sp. M5D2P9]